MNERMVSHYRLVEALGSGSMGRVYKAWDTRLDRWVAIKFLPPELADDTAACNRFHREAQAASSLEHGHICTIYDIDQDDAGGSFLVMAWYDGETLAARLQGGALPAKQALDYARQTALGLAAAHRQGIVHRDIKPANVIITRDGEAVILDFGVAYLMDQTRLSRPGSRSGTLAYMAPEQFRGAEPSSAMDIWSLGILLYEMLTGRLPFKGDYTAALTYAIAHDDPLPLPEDIAAAVPGSRAVMDRCLAKHPQDRYGSAADLAADLTLLINETHAGLVASKRPPRIVGRWKRRLAFGVAAAVLVGVGIVAQMMGLIGSGSARPRGVAVLPFVVEEAGESRREFGEGLAWLLGNELGHLAGWTDAYWIVPPEDLLLYEVADRDAVRDKFGIDRTITGTGTISGSILTLTLEYEDASGGPARREVFRDDLANLPTWQRDLGVWAAAELAPDLATEAAGVVGRAQTQVPGALYAFLDGIAWSRRYAPRYSELQLEYRSSALRALGEAVARDSSYAAARSEYAHALHLGHGAGDSTWAGTCEFHLRVAIALDPLDAEPHGYLGDLHLALGDTQQALAAYDEALLCESGFKPALLAKLKVAIGRRDEAHAENVLQAMHAARPRYAIDCLNAGMEYWTASDMPSAVARFREAADWAPRSARAKWYLGAALFELDKNPEAEVLFRQALAIEPNPQIHHNLGTYYYYDNRFHDALIHYRKALEANPAGDYGLWRGIAECYRWTPAYRDSVRPAYQRTRKLAEQQLANWPGEPSLTADLATFCSVLGDTARTLELLDELAANEHLSAQEEFMVAVAWNDLGRRGKALDWLERALDHGLRLTRVEGYPGFKDLRPDPRYAQIVKEHR